MLENEDNGAAFGPNSKAPYLAKTLVSQGAYLKNYYGIGHNSLDNYIALISGQAPNRATQLDCHTYTEFQSRGMTTDGQAIGEGCVYPAQVQDLGTELNRQGFSWREYAEDMGNDPHRDGVACGHPALGSPDPTIKAEPAPSGGVADQYTTRHNPFAYFHSTIDSPLCTDYIVNLRQLSRDFESDYSAPNLAFITPNLCNDGHDSPCVTGDPGGLVSVNAWLSQIVPQIMASPAYKHDGLLLILFDESDVDVRADAATGTLAMTGDASACCEEQSGPNVAQAGQIGPGGGNTGAVALSPFIKPGTVSQVPYNHYSTLRTIEKIFGLPYMGYSNVSGLATFGPDIFTRSPQSQLITGDAYGDTVNKPKATRSNLPER
ncbi:MAG: phosphoesterase [Candidatus Eremiobacteraeota bacterium]|nr:phosphoesterase [Candidatus Eremiobacteraeota bacterium]